MSKTVISHRGNKMDHTLHSDDVALFADPEENDPAWDDEVLEDTAFEYGDDEDEDGAQ